MSALDGGPGERLVFANQLRGVAALAVVLVHYTVVVQTARPAVAWVVAAPPLEGPVPSVARWVAASPVDVGGTGVALFFLISGFVIPFSLARLSPGRFLLARAWRVLPTFWVALALGGGSVAASGWWWGRTPPFGVGDYAVTGTLLGGWLGRGTVDWVSWTLSVEALFYVAAAACRPWLLRRPVVLTACWGVACLGLNVAARHGLAVPAEAVLEVTFLPHILLGTLFHAHFERRLSWAGLGGAVAGVAGLVAVCWWAGPSPGELAGRGGCMVVAVVVFGGAYLVRERFGRGWFGASRVLDGAAAVSYPLYLVHCLVGFPVMSLLVVGWGVPYEAAAVLAFGLVLGVAAGLHWAVERPSLRVGRWMASGGRRAGLVVGGRRVAG